MNKIYWVAVVLTPRWSRPKINVFFLLDHFWKITRQSSSILSFESLDYSDHVLTTNWTLGHLFSTVSAGTHMSTLQHHTVDLEKNSFSYNSEAFSNYIPENPCKSYTKNRPPSTRCYLCSSAPASKVSGGFSTVHPSPHSLWSWLGSWPTSPWSALCSVPSDPPGTRSRRGRLNRGLQISSDCRVEKRRWPGV